MIVTRSSATASKFRCPRLLGSLGGLVGLLVLASVVYVFLGVLQVVGALLLGERSG